MSEYWKSNPRKFCDFCKCWIADNKPSIEFHERGKRHKENVQKRLEEIGKKGKEDYENKLKEGDYMREMEEAALRAYKKDLEQNPDVTGQKIVGIAQASNAQIVVSGGKSVETWKREEKAKKKIPIKPQPKWQEAKTPEGFSYYWHKETGESVWEAPKEGYVSIDDTKPKNQETPEHKSRHKKAKDFTKSGASESKSANSNVKKESKVSKEKDVLTSSSTVTYGPMVNTNPYGNWESTFQPVNEIDLQLPTVPEQEYYAPEVVTRRPEVKFEEKIVTLSKSKVGGPVSFRKRKGGEELKKNVRRRVDE